MAQVRRRGPNTYTISVYLGRDPGGKRQFKNETFYGTKTQAKHRAAELEIQLKRTIGPKGSLKMGEYLDHWMKKINGKVTQRTWQTYEWHVRHLKEVLGELPLYGLNCMILQDALDELDGLSPRTIRGMYGTLRTALRKAITWGLLHNDLAAGIQAPRVPRKERRVLAKSEVVKLLEATRDYKHGLAIRLLALTGMRLGEVLGLKWQDIDFDKSTVTVKRAKDSKFKEIKETKTVSAQRVLILDVITLKEIKQYRELFSNGKVVSINKKDSDLIFRTSNGKMLSEKTVRQTFAGCLKKAGIEHMRLHDLRHSAGSILLDEGVSIATVAAFLGHSTPATTVAVYAHTVRKGVSIAGYLYKSDKESDKVEKIE